MLNAAPVMETREEPKFVQFATGDVVEGTLVNMERIAVKDKPAIRYTVKRVNEFLTFLGTYQLNTKLHREDLGHRVEIRCVGEDTMVKRGENCMKVFDVKVSRDPVSKARTDVIADTEISDDDIPF